MDNFLSSKTMDKLLPCSLCGGIKQFSFEKQTSRLMSCAIFSIHHCRLSTHGSTLEEAISNWNKLPRPLQWTHRPPTREGYYWFMDAKIASNIPEGIISEKASKKNNFFLDRIFGFWHYPLYGA